MSTAVELEVPYGPSRFVWARRVLLNWDVVVVEADEHQHVLVATCCDEIDVQPGEFDRHPFERRVDRHRIPVAAYLSAICWTCC